MSSPSPLLCFRLSQLLAFYLSTVEGLLGAGSQLAGNFKIQSGSMSSFKCYSWCFCLNCVVGRLVDDLLCFLWRGLPFCPPQQ